MIKIQEMWAFIIHHWHRVHDLIQITRHYNNFTPFSQRIMYKSDVWTVARAKWTDWRLMQFYCLKNGFSICSFFYFFVVLTQECSLSSCSEGGRGWASESCVWRSLWPDVLPTRCGARWHPGDSFLSPRSCGGSQEPPCALVSSSG